MDSFARPTHKRTYLSIPPDEAVQGRPFTDPLEAVRDVATIRHMVARLNAVLRAQAAWPAVLEPPCRFLLTEDGEIHQVVVSRPHELMERLAFVVVGFFGQMRAGADQTTLPAIQEVDEALIAEFPRYSGILSYSSLRLPAGNWGNVAFFADMDAMENWNCNRRHVDAVKKLAAAHYDSIRLHVGLITQGLCGCDLRLVRTKYFQYEPEGVWKALADRTSRCPLGFSAENQPQSRPA